MSNIKITIAEVEKEYEVISYLKSKNGDIYLFGTYYREVEPVKQDYEIQSFRSLIGNIWILKDNYYVTEGCKHSNTIHRMLECLSKKTVDIYSVKRLTDGEVFTVWETQSQSGNITKFTIDEVGVLVHHFNGDILCLDLVRKVKQPAILLTTEDNVTVTDKHHQLLVLSCGFEKLDCLADYISKFPNCKYFSTEAARDKYILQNKPVTVTLNEWLDSSLTATEFFKSKQK